MTAKDVGEQHQINVATMTELIYVLNWLTAILFLAIVFVVDRGVEDGRQRDWLTLTLDVISVAILARALWNTIKRTNAYRTTMTRLWEER